MIINNKHLQRITKAKGLTIQGLADAANLSYPTVHKALNKEGKSVNAETLQKLAKGLETTFEELVSQLVMPAPIELEKRRAEKLERELEKTRRELKKAKRKLEPKTEKVNLLLKKYQLNTLKELAEEREESLNNFVCTLIDELIERDEDREETK